jgi:hypothetical protein
MDNAQYKTLQVRTSNYVNKFAYQIFEQPFKNILPAINIS